MRLMNYTFLIVTFLINCYFAFSQDDPSYELKKLSKESVVLKINDKNIDTLSTFGIEHKKTFIKIKNDKVFMSNLVVPGVGSFANAYISVGIWEVSNNELKGNPIKIKLKKCNIRKLKFKLVENGIEWRVRRGLFRKKLKGFMPFNSDSKEYVIKCIEKLKF